MNTTNYAAPVTERTRLMLEQGFCAASPIVRQGDDIENNEVTINKQDDGGEFNVPAFDETEY